MSNSKKTVIVTGASSGIGFAIAQAYLLRGDNVVGNARTVERLQQAAAKLDNAENFLGVAGDIAKPETAEALFTQAIARFGRVDVLVNNAGVFIAKPVTEYTEADLASLVATNLQGFFFPAQQAAAHMKTQGGGHIVSITANIGLQPTAKLPATLPVLIKGGINAATRHMAVELASDNIRVNAVAPGIIETPLHTSFADSEAFLNQLSPSGRVGSVQDVVAAVLYLTESSYVSGTIMAVDGGAAAGVW
ncbi:SDR family NAD(P)-dependent oxidoreductase [Rheinheimera sp. MM224]|uniref:SDR family NAD(P)-dependent oxidoreductase n=1 Tax=Rheinheimera sp. MM224 TaxID=3019969 RepID=UPI0021F83CED|nr:SDR family NAD(P)-dependent oxidoreductase [Rheinheimera sp. MM224]CAI3806335.1 Dihydroanticapsin 7-dehydrogenase [Rheinheimera sp. MM224]